jgi:hypothetical protein
MLIFDHFKLVYIKYVVHNLYIHKLTLDLIIIHRTIAMKFESKS